MCYFGKLNLKVNMLLVNSVKGVNVIIIIAIYKPDFVRMPLSLPASILRESLNKRSYHEFMLKNSDKCNCIFTS